MSKGGTGDGTALERAFRERTSRRLGGIGVEALLITDRSAAWLPTANPVKPADAMAFDDPAIWDDRSGTRWTPDLVHCRLVEAGNILKRLPAPAGPRDHVTIWRLLAPAERLIAPPSTAEIAMCEWTLDQVMALTVTDRVIAMGSALTMSAQRIADQLAAGIAQGTVVLARGGVAKRYRKIQERLAGAWNDAGAKIDRGTYERRQAMLERKSKS